MPVATHAARGALAQPQEASANMQPVKRTTTIHPVYYFISGGLLLLVALGWAVLIASASDFNGGAFNFACPSAVLVLGAAVLFIGVRQQMVVSRVSRPEVNLSSQSPRVGETVTLSYQQTFRARTAVKAIEFQLIRRESETHHSGKSEVTQTHDTIVQEHKLPAQTFEAGQSFQEQYPFQPQGMHTFQANWHKVNWLIRARVELDGLPAFSEEYPLQVSPETAE